MPRHSNAEEDSALLLIDTASRPVYISEGATELLNADELGRILASGDDLRIDPCKYRVSRLPIQNLAQGSLPTVAILIQRTRDGGPEMKAIAAEYRLTPRETEVLALLLDGVPPKQIAANLGISYSTTKTFLRVLAGKVGAVDRTEVVAKLLRSKL